MNHVLLELLLYHFPSLCFDLVVLPVSESTEVIDKRGCLLTRIFGAFAADVLCALMECSPELAYGIKSH